MESAQNYNNFLVGSILETNSAIRVLDFGAGLGTLASELRERGREPLCVEPDSRLYRILKENNHEVYLSLGEIPKGEVEFVYSFNVLEHIKDDGRALRGVWEVLKPGGTLLLYVPAFPLLYSAMDKKVGHYRRYRAGSLCRLLKTKGFQIEYASYVDSLGFMATLAYKLIGDSEGNISRRSVEIHDKWVLPISWRLDYLFGKFFGKNLMVRARRLY